MAQAELLRGNAEQLSNALKRHANRDDLLLIIPAEGNGSHPASDHSAEEIERANARLRRHILDQGIPGGLDNDAIDRDLARAYDGMPQQVDDSL